MFLVKNWHGKIQLSLMSWKARIILYSAKNATFVHEWKPGLWAFERKQPLVIMARLGDGLQTVRRERHNSFFSLSRIVYLLSDIRFVFFSNQWVEAGYIDAGYGSRCSRSNVEALHLDTAYGYGDFTRWNDAQWLVADFPKGSKLILAVTTAKPSQSC